MDSAPQLISQSEPPKAGNFPSLGAWAGFQLVPWRGEASYPITSLLSQPVPPGLRSYKHQPVLRGDLRRAPHWFQMEKRPVWGKRMLTFSFQEGQNNNTITRNDAAPNAAHKPSDFLPQTPEQEVVLRGLWAESAAMCALCPAEVPSRAGKEARVGQALGFRRKTCHRGEGRRGANNQVAIFMRKLHLEERF